jgi:hypothetical protein
LIYKKTYKIWALRLLLVILLGGLNSAYAQTKPPLEYQIKAAFLFNFTRFVHWPTTAYLSSDSPFIIGVVGKDPFGRYLDELMSGEAVDGHRIIVRRFNDDADLSSCQLVFFNLDEPQKLKSTLTQLSRQSTLCVSDNDDFLRMGGILHFYMEDNKVKMEINLSAAKAAKLEISAKLLQLAKLK